jgi:hypothetical protein
MPLTANTCTSHPDHASTPRPEGTLLRRRRPRRGPSTRHHTQLPVRRECARHVRRKARSPPLGRTILLLQRPVGQSAVFRTSGDDLSRLGSKRPCMLKPLRLTVNPGTDGHVDPLRKFPRQMLLQPIDCARRDFDELLDAIPQTRHP